MPKLICPRCGSGTHCCTDRTPGGTAYTSPETCATYEYALDVCDPCAEDLGWERKDPTP